MKFNEEFASIHGYLCADGYVIRNPEIQKHKYYYIGLRNKNIILLKDFQKNFQKIFGLRPIITKQMDRCKIQNKKLTMFLLQKFGSFHSGNWNLPNFSKNEIRRWLRSYFDCDGWVSLVKAKDRKIGLESINENGLKQIQKVLKKFFNISSNVKHRKDRNI